MKVLIMAGHSKSGYIGSGASKYLDESNETRRLGLKVVEHLKAIGVNADYICLDKPKTAKYLNEQVALANSKGTYDVVVQIHFNAGSSDPNSNTTGTETYYRTSSGKPYSDRVNAKLSTLFKNRGSKKDTRGLYWLKYTKCPAILIEVCFVDDKDDAKIYLSNIDKIARLIAEGIAPQDESFKVEVICNELSVRTDASSKATIVEQVHSGEVFTIIETKGVWGRLKSNLGWINISSRYCKKI